MEITAAGLKTLIAGSERTHYEFDGENRLEKGVGKSQEDEESGASNPTMSDIQRESSSRLPGSESERSAEDDEEEEEEVSVCSVLPSNVIPSKEVVLSAGDLETGDHFPSSNGQISDGNIESNELIEIDLNQRQKDKSRPEEEEEVGTQMHSTYRHYDDDSPIRIISSNRQEPQHSCSASHLNTSSDYTATTSNQQGRQKSTITPPPPPKATTRGFADAPAKLTVVSRRVRDYLESLKLKHSPGGRSYERRRFYQFFKSIRTELVASLLFTLISSQALIVSRIYLGGERLEEISPETETETKQSGNHLSVHLSHGAADAITVATLTQVFGHVSGCHLLPSVSLALYVKGHITGARLGSYLAAQSTGPLLAAALLALLTGSQVTSREYVQMIAEQNRSLAISSTANLGGLADGSGGESKRGQLLRRRRGSFYVPPDTRPPASPAFPQTDGRLESGETKASDAHGRSARRLRRQTDINLDERQASEGILMSIMEQLELGRQVSSTPPSGGGPVAPARGTISANDEEQKRKQAATISGGGSVLPLAAGDGPINGPSELANKIKLRRRKRNRGQQAAAAPNQTGSGQNYVNLLEFALPEQVMGSDSIRECVATETARSGGRHWSTRNVFLNCIVRSNASQMFVFQLLATLVVLLTYLINVDPRHVDLGHKSLSIGLSYFVAGLLTVQSGGFYGNPMQVLALSWLSSSSKSLWRDHWFIYLLIPFIGGLFGALSHEYIDFTSLRNKDRPLRLRRSFYSLDGLPAQVPGLQMRTMSGGGAGQAEPERTRRPSSSSLATSASSGYSNCQEPPEQQQLRQAGEQTNTTIITSVADCQPAHLARPNRKLSGHARQLRSEGQQCRMLLNGPLRRPSDFDSNFLISSSLTSPQHQLH